MFYTIKIYEKLSNRIYRESVEADSYEDAVMFAMRKLGKKFGSTPYRFVEAREKHVEPSKLEAKGVNK